MEKTEINEELDQLKRDLYSYNHYTKALRREYINEISEIDYKMIGINKKESSILSNSSIYREKKNKLITRKNELENKMIKSKEYLLVNHIDESICQLTNEDASLIREKYFYEESYSNISKMIYLSKTATIKKIEIILIKLINIKKKQKL